MPYAVGNNAPGYLPDSEPVQVNDFDTARLFLIDDMLYAVDQCDSSQEDDAEALTLAAEDVNLWVASWDDMARNGELSVTVAGRAWWIQRIEKERGECTPGDDGWCTGGCITRPHRWSASGARCTRTGCNVAGTGDACNDGNCEGCEECSEDYGPCEDHCTVLVQREGASTRTADDLFYVYLCDMVDVIADQTGDENVLSPWGEDVLERAGALLDQNDHYGCRWLPEDESEFMRDDMTTLQYQLEASVSTLDQTIWTTWDDGFWIIQVHEDCPLLDA